MESGDSRTAAKSVALKYFAIMLFYFIISLTVQNVFISKKGFYREILKILALILEEFHNFPINKK